MSASIHLAETLKVRRNVRRFGKYAVIADLGTGGAGDVFLAKKEGAVEPCVLKTLRVELTQHEVAHRRMQREAHLSAFLAHQNIAPILDAGSEHGIFYLATEYVPGVELAQLLEVCQGKISVPLAIRIATEILSGLAHAHDAVDADGTPLGVVHRDLTPRNVMLAFDGAVKIIDFGIARSAIDGFATRPGIVVGTPYYLSPEMARGDGCDRRADLYAVGVLLFEMITGRHLVEDGKLLEVLESIALLPRPRLSAIDPSLPERLVHVVARALELDPSKRWSSAAELRESLLQVSKTTGIATGQELGAFLRSQFQERHQWTEDLRRRSMNERASSGIAMIRTADEIPAISGLDALQTVIEIPKVEVPLPIAKPQRPSGARDDLQRTEQLLPAAPDTLLLPALRIVTPAAPAPAIAPHLQPAQSRSGAVVFVLGLLVLVSSLALVMLR